jgi:hypothetical protein
MRHKATVTSYTLLEIEDNILDLPFIDFSKLPDKYGRDNFIGLVDYQGLYLLSWEDLVKCWDKQVRFYFDGMCYDKIDNFTQVIVKYDYGYDSLHEYLTDLLK